MKKADEALNPTVGIEEEYLLVDRTTRDIVVDPPRAFLDECHEQLPGQTSPEFLRCQIEVGTRVCNTIGEARADLARLRTTLNQIASGHNMAIIAASTHPFAGWGVQQHTARERYEQLSRDIGFPSRRLMICGMHVHAGIADDELRIDLMNQVRFFLPHLLALSTSSPFWEGEDTRLMGYRLAVWNELPRTGMPDPFQSYADYQQFLGTLVEAGVIEDATKLWWDVRPSARFQTLEMRISDMCTRLDDTVTIAALYLCLLRMLERLRQSGMSWRSCHTMLIEENRWRAQRYGTRATMLDGGQGRVVPYAEALENILALVHEDAEALGCRTEVENARTILKRGTSAHQQRAIWQDAMAQGADSREALRAVVDWLIAETAACGNAAPSKQEKSATEAIAAASR